MAAKPAWDFSSSPLKIHYVDEKDIHQKTKHLSDISPHLPLIKLLSSQCDKVIEFGVRAGNSTIAILAGNPQQLISVDINLPELYLKDPRWKFIQSTSINPNLDLGYADMLLIDSLHEYDHCIQELMMWNKRIKLYICLHDVVSCPGVRQAVDEFLENKKEWKSVYYTPIAHGFEILQRV